MTLSPNFQTLLNQAVAEGIRATDILCALGNPASMTPEAREIVRGVEEYLSVNAK